MAVGLAIGAGKAQPGVLLPAPRETRRKALREHGLEISSALAKGFNPWLKRLDVAAPWAEGTSEK